jgi:hypothetical protein
MGRDPAPMPRLYTPLPSRLDFLWNDAHPGVQDISAQDANMAHYATANHDHDRSALKGRNNLYRFGSVQTRHGRGRVALKRTNGCLRTLIEKIADTKVRRMRRERAGASRHSLRSRERNLGH